jgi:hypothetical protein
LALEQVSGAAEAASGGPAGAGIWLRAWVAMARLCRRAGRPVKAG